MAAVLVCGPEGSGTHLLEAIVRDYLLIEPISRSLPYAGQWWTVDGLDPATGEPFPSARVVVITRRPDVTALCLLGKKPPLADSISEARQKWHDAMVTLSQIAGAYWLSYEALILAPKVQADNLAAWLGVEPGGVLPEIVDGNAKWLTVLG